MITKVYALQGFLGLPSDWDRLGEGVGASFEALEPFALAHPREGLRRWGRALNDWIAKQPAQKRILLGYSQGGRLAMHALLDAPELWSCAIFVSAHTGLQTSEERAARLQRDKKWAERFLQDPWDVLIGDWDRQVVFQEQMPVFCRQEGDYDRSLLAHALEGWSVGGQEDLREPLSKLLCPLLWVAGERDVHYVKLAKQMAAIHPHSSCWIAPESGHRVPWECPQLFLQQVYHARLCHMDPSEKSLKSGDV